MNVLGVESSCDETGVALVDADTRGVPRLLAQALHSQIDMHQAYGGVVPELASRDHIRRVLPLMAEGSAIASISSNGGMGWSRRIPTTMQLLQIDNYEGAVKWCEDNADQVKEGYAFSKEAIILWTMLFSNRLIKRGLVDTRPDKEDARLLLIFATQAAAYSRCSRVE